MGWQPVQTYYGMATRSNLLWDGNPFKPIMGWQPVQTYYGMATRSNVGDLNKTKKAIYAAFFMCALQKKTIIMRTVRRVLIVGAHTTMI